MNNIIVESCLKEEEVVSNVFDRLLQNRMIFINSIDIDEVATDIVATLLYFESISNEKIIIFINSEGGDVRNALMIYDTMKILKSPIETFCIGSAMGTAALLLAAGTKGHRLISKNSDVCISQITHIGFAISDLTDTKIINDKLKRDNLSFMKELSKCSNRPLKQLFKETDRQLFLNPQQAVKYGIVDKVV